jgi:acyl carrier protein
MPLDRLQAVFREALEAPDLILRPELRAQDVPTWDSFNHINLVLGIEEAFSVQFTTREITSLQNVGDLIKLLQTKGCNIT